MIGTGARAGLLEEDGSLPGTGRVPIADASATVLGALCGTSTVTCYAESAAGSPPEGARADGPDRRHLLFAGRVFSPLAGIMTAAATAPAMIIVGMYLLMEIKRVDFSQMDDALPAFATIVTPCPLPIPSQRALPQVFFPMCCASWRPGNGGR